MRHTMASLETPEASARRAAKSAQITSACELYDVYVELVLERGLKVVLFSRLKTVKAIQTAIDSIE